jgi:transposase
MQQALRNLEAGWSRHFDSLKKRKSGEIRPDEAVGPPEFKKKSKSRQSFRYPDPKQFKVDQQNGRIFLPRLGWVRYRNSRKMEGHACNVTISRDGRKWFVSIQTEREVEKPVHPSGSMVGMDLGLVRFATLSNGEVVEPCKTLKRQQVRLKRYQRRMGRRVKFSKNWNKAKDRVNSSYHKIRNIRSDFLPKTSTAISKNHAVVVIENLGVQNMSKSAAGSQENPGRNVKQKSGLTAASWIKHGASFAASWNTSRAGLVGSFCLFHPSVLARRVRAVDTFRHAIERHRLFSCVSLAATPRMRTRLRL